MLLFFIVALISLLYVNHRINKIDVFLESFEKDLKTYTQCFKPCPRVAYDAFIRDNPHTYSTSYGSSRQKARNKETIRRYGKKYKRSFAIWSPEEDRALKYEVKTLRLDLFEISRLHFRTPNAINIRLKYLRLYV